MCGNLGLLLSFTDRGRVRVKIVASSDDPQGKSPVLLPSASILREMAAATEVRGGQAGGFSAIQVPRDKSMMTQIGRVRMVTRKRFTLSDDLELGFKAHCPRGDPDYASHLSVIGHTRFATSSLNTVPELHPHDWFYSGYPADASGPRNGARLSEEVYAWDPSARVLVPSTAKVVIQISHNGDFDSLDAYGGVVLNSELGWWLEHVLQCRNSTAGDSPKIAGLIEVLRVQGLGRVGAARVAPCCVLGARGRDGGAAARGGAAVRRGEGQRAIGRGLACRLGQTLRQRLAHVQPCRGRASRARPDALLHLAAGAA
jgi:hypothetical protein